MYFKHETLSLGQITGTLVSNRMAHVAGRLADLRGLKLYEVNLENHPEMETVFAKRDLKQIIHALEAICDRQF